MPYSISCRKSPEQKTAFTEGELAPTAGEGLEIRVNESLFVNKVDFFTQLEKLKQVIWERRQPRF